MYPLSHLNVFNNIDCVKLMDVIIVVAIMQLNVSLKLIVMCIYIYLCVCKRCILMSLLFL